MKKKVGKQEQWIALDKNLSEALPNIMSTLGNEDDFDRLLIKNRPEGGYLAVLKCNGPDGGVLVCFGSGYGTSACLLGLEAAIQGNNFRPDRPWPNKGKGK